MADVDLSTLGSVIKTAYEGEADTNALTDSLLALVNAALQPGANISVLTNDSGFIASGANISVLTNDSGFITELVGDTTPQLGGQLDVNGQALGDGTLELLKFTETASAVNEFTIANAATGNDPVLSATGDDANVGITLTPKGTGNVSLGNFTFDADATIGAGQDNYVLTYDNSSGTWGPEAAASGGWDVDDDTNRNYAHGLNALDSVFGSGFWNVCIGYNSGTAITGGDGNTYIGDSAGATNTVGSNSVCIGRNAGANASSPESCVFVGQGAGLSGSGPVGSVCLGDGTGDGSSNISYLTAVGQGAASGNATHTNGVAIGASACSSGASQYSVIIGKSAGAWLNTGSQKNIIIGESSGVSVNGEYNLILGTGAAPANPTEDYIFYLGNDASPPIEGRMAPRSDIDHSGKNITITGTSAYDSASTNLNAGDLILRGGSAATTGAGVGGDLALRGGAPGSTGTAGKISMQDGADTTKEAKWDLSAITTSTVRTITMPDADVDLGALGGGWDVDDDTNYNYGHGSGALGSITTGSGIRNVAIGYNAGSSITTGDYSVAIGYAAGSGITTTSESVAIGANTSSGALSSAVVIGSTGTTSERAGGTSQCSASVIIGHQAGKSMSGSGTQNTLIGFRSGQNISTGLSNICIGAGANGPTTGSYCIQISPSATSLPSDTDDNQIVIGRGSTVLVPFVQGYGGSGDDNSSRQTLITGPSAQLNLTSGNVSAGDLVLRGGLASTTSAGDGGDLFLRAGAGGNTGTDGDVYVADSDTAGISFFNATAVAQQSGTGETTGFTAGSGTSVNDDSTFTGNVGSTAYRINDIVKALKNYGLLAQ